MEMEYDDLKGWLHIKQATGKRSTLWSGDSVVFRGGAPGNTVISIAENTLNGADEVAVAWYDSEEIEPERWRQTLRGLWVYDRSRKMELFRWGEVPKRDIRSRGWFCAQEAELEAHQGGHTIETITFSVNPLNGELSRKREANVMAW